jgi:hypothetical protein
MENALSSDVALFMFIKLFRTGAMPVQNAEKPASTMP